MNYLKSNRKTINKHFNFFIIILFTIVSYDNVLSQNNEEFVFGQQVPSLQLGEWINKAPAPNQNPFQDKITILEFWATWCGPCVKAIPHINELVDSLKDEPVIFVSITKEPREKVIPFVEKNPMKAYVVLDQNGITNNDYKIRFIPKAFIIHPTGALLWHGHPSEITLDFLRKILDEYYYKWLQNQNQEQKQ